MGAPEPLLAIVGPTASGKSELALALAERFNGEIISADSVQVYRYFDIGSGKATAAERQRVPHHGIDVREPTDEVDASVFGELACGWIDEVRARGRVPVVCGGTFLWVRALMYGLVQAPPKDAAIRQRHQDFVEHHGRPALHEQLRAIDPKSHARLNPNDMVRVSRALEVYELTGTPLTELQERHGFASLRHRPIFVGIEHTKEQLTERIEARVNAMLDAGLYDEVSTLIAKGFGNTRPMNSVGYKQVKAALAAERGPSREVLSAEIVRATRVFSRRQRTWLRDQDVTWLTADEARRAELPPACLSRLAAI